MWIKRKDNTIYNDNMILIPKAYYEYNCKHPEILNSDVDDHTYYKLVLEAIKKEEIEAKFINANCGVLVNKDELYKYLPEKIYPVIKEQMELLCNEYYICEENYDMFSKLENNYNYCRSHPLISGKKMDIIKKYRKYCSKLPEDLFVVNEWSSNIPSSGIFAYNKELAKFEEKMYKNSFSYFVYKGNVLGAFLPTAKLKYKRAKTVYFGYKKADKKYEQISNKMLSNNNYIQIFDKCMKEDNYICGDTNRIGNIEADKLNSLTAYGLFLKGILTIIYTKSDTKNNLKKFKENVKIKRELIKNASNEELADCIGIFLKDYVKNDINRKCSEKFTFSLEKDSLGKYEKRGIPTLDEVIPVIEETIKETYDKLGLTCNYDKFANMVRPIYIGKSDDKIKNAVETEDCIFAERI